MVEAGEPAAIRQRVASGRTETEWDDSNLDELLPRRLAVRERYEP